ncbi:MAG: hypothetical protein ACKVQQ_02780, partial [Burkholderiales bacterium]
HAGSARPYQTTNAIGAKAPARGGNPACEIVLFKRQAGEPLVATVVGLQLWGSGSRFKRFDAADPGVEARGGRKIVFAQASGALTEGPGQSYVADSSGARRGEGVNG